MYLRKFRPDLVRALRRRKRKTQQGLAEEAGISQVSISAIENGRKEPRTATLLGISRALECNMDAFFE